MYKICIRYDLQPSRKEIRVALQAELNKQRLAQRVEKIKSVVCPEHKRQAKISLVNGELELGVCCKKLEAAIREELEPE